MTTAQTYQLLFTRAENNHLLDRLRQLRLHQSAHSFLGILQKLRSFPATRGKSLPAA